MRRRLFLKQSFLTIGVLLFLNGKLYAATSPYKTLEILLKDIFPANKNTPTIDSSNVIFYIENVIMKHSRVNQDKKQFILNGIQWINEEALKKYKKIYPKLEKEKREKILEIVVRNSWGEDYLYTIMCYMFEAILGDPIYNINKNELGWRWLNFKTGLPRPKKAFL